MEKYNELLREDDKIYFLKTINQLNKELINIHKKEIKYLPVCKHIWIIEAGFMIALRSNFEGRLKGMGIFGPGDIIGVSGYGGNTRTITLIALINTTVFSFPFQEFKAHSEKDPKLSQYLLKYVCRRYDTLHDELEYSTLPLDKRIELFREQAKDVIPPNEDIYLPDSLLAWAVGAHPVSVSRLLNNK